MTNENNPYTQLPPLDGGNDFGGRTAKMRPQSPGNTEPSMMYGAPTGPRFNAPAPAPAPAGFSMPSGVAAHGFDGKKWALPFILSIVALVLVFIGSSVVFLEVCAVACGIAALVVRKRSDVPRSNQRAPKATSVMSIASIALGVLMVIALIGGTGQLGVNVSAPESLSGKTIVVHMEGTLEDGTLVSDNVNVVPGETKLVSEARPGSYTFKIDAASLSDDEHIYKVENDSQTCVFTKKENATAEFVIVLDEAAMKEKAEKEAKLKAEEEAKAKAEAEAKAQAEAEAKAKAEEEAAAQRAAEEQARAEAEAQAAAQQEQPAASNERTVYITSNGEKYHVAGCRHLKKSGGGSPIALSDAISRGYTPCGTCNP